MSVLFGAAAGDLADAPPATAPTVTDASGGVVFSRKLSVTALGRGRIIRFG